VFGQHVGVQSIKRLVSGVGTSSVSDVDTELLQEGYLGTRSVGTSSVSHVDILGCQA
jgi:hypothetical protein